MSLWLPGTQNRRDFADSGPGAAAGRRGPRGDSNGTGVSLSETTARDSGPGPASGPICQVQAPPGGDGPRPAGAAFPSGSTRKLPALTRRPGAVAAWPPPGGPHWTLRGGRPSTAAAALPALALRLRPIIVAILAMCCALPVNRRIQLGRVRRFRVKFRQVRARGTQVGTHIAASVLCTEMQPRPWALRAGLCCHSLSVVSRGLRLSLMGT